MVEFYAYLGYGPPIASVIAPPLARRQTTTPGQLNGTPIFATQKHRCSGLAPGAVPGRRPSRQLQESLVLRARACPPRPPLVTAATGCDGQESVPALRGRCDSSETGRLSIAMPACSNLDRASSRHP